MPSWLEDEYIAEFDVGGDEYTVRASRTALVHGVLSIIGDQREYRLYGVWDPDGEIDEAIEEEITSKLKVRA